MVIGTPPDTHYNILKKILKGNPRAVLIEKPLCTNIKDCFDLKKITSHYPGMIWTAMEYRYMPPVKNL